MRKRERERERDCGFYEQLLYAGHRPALSRSDCSNSKSPVSFASVLYRHCFRTQQIDGSVCNENMSAENLQFRSLLFFRQTASTFRSAFNPAVWAQHVSPFLSFSLFLILSSIFICCRGNVLLSGWDDEHKALWCRKRVPCNNRPMSFSLSEKN